ncbi:MAG: YtxH domain-containing protein [Acidobacteriota bacterium]|nr:YtxH domain-containing protein [Acidobacteriota bacterium]
MQRDKSGTMIAWFVGGTILGAAVALLVAPQSGAKTRGKLADQAEKGRKSLMESSHDIISRGRELYERGREIAEETAELFERGRKIAEKSIDDRI